jgi:hypothetical protein
MTPEQRAEAARFLAEPCAPEMQAKSDAMVALAQGFRERALVKVDQLETLRVTSPAVLEALNMLYDIVALETARCQALDCGTPSIEAALAEYDLAPSITYRVATLRKTGSN